jgi:hypothetical protein
MANMSEIIKKVNWFINGDPLDDYDILMDYLYNDLVVLQ